VMDDLLELVADLAVIALCIAVAPLLIVGAAAWVAGDVVGCYFYQLFAMVVRRAPEFQRIAPYVSLTEDGPGEPAYRQYFFGPAMRDLRQVIVLGWERGRHRTLARGSQFTARTLTESEYSRLTWPLAVALWTGLVIGAAVGALIGGALVTVHACAAGFMQGIARAGAVALRAIDTLVLLARGIRGMRCPWCYDKNSYPAYRCECGLLHHDIRPGPYGVFRRRCACDRFMRTLIWLGSYRMNAFCRYRGCGEQMSDETGRFREIVLPMLGGVAAGKTRLMATMLVALHEAASRPPGADDAVGLRLANVEVRRDYAVLSNVLDEGRPTSATARPLPGARSLLLRTGRRGRLVHIFDASGERLRSRLDAASLRYLAAARTFVFVLDPMSAPGFRSSVTDQEMSAIDHVLISTDDPLRVFAQWVQETGVMEGAALGRSRLVVAISKTDLIAHTTLLDGYTNDDQWARQWLARLGLGALVRAMDKAFHNRVRFFFTAAITIAPGRAHESIHPLVAWSLRLPVQSAAAVPATRSEASGN
jgi:hypothetical protein